MASQQQLRNYGVAPLTLTMAVHSTPRFPFARSCFFALSEVKLGVIPATISPYVVAKIGPSNARRLFMTGETVNVDKAKEIGLVQEIVDTPEAMAKKAQEICDAVLLAAPGAAVAAKVRLHRPLSGPRQRDILASIRLIAHSIRTTHDIPPRSRACAMVVFPSLGSLRVRVCSRWCATCSTSRSPRR